MKRKVLFVLLSVILVTSCIVCLTACGPKHEHDYTQIVIEPTCTTQGYTTHTCSCGDSFVDAVVPALNHSYTDVTTAPTCTEQGFTMHTCGHCGDSYKDTVVDALTHNYKTVVTAPTCTANGYTTHTCTRCSDEFVDSYVSALGHNYVGDVCTRCHGIRPLQSTEIRLATLSLTGDTIYEKVSNATTVFSFINEVSVADGATWYLSTDIYGISTIPTKTIPLVVGDNQCYILVSNGNDIALYNVTIRRRPMYNVTFNSNGGTAAENQIVEEDSFATIPTTTRIGYTFDSWNYDFSTPITSNKTITASWIANKNTPYKVEYYLQNFADDNYTLTQTVKLAGTTDTTVTAEQKVIEHFTFNSSKSTQSGNVNGNGSLVLKMYYTRNVYNLSNADSNLGSVTYVGSYKYGSASVMATATAGIGCNFDGWYCGNELLSSKTTYTFSATQDVTAKFSPETEMSSFDFIATTSSCTITGIKDNTIASIVVPDYVTSIGKSAFSGCSSLTEITLPFVGNTLDGTWNTTHFGYIFGADSYSSNSSCVPSSLKKVTITKAKSIGNWAFYNCSSLTSIIISDSVTSIGESAFSGCSGLTSVTIGDSVTSIGSSAFSCCSSLTSITIPDSVTSIGGYAFRGCSSLTSITIPDSVTSIGKSAFSGCSSLTEITLPFVGNTLDGTSNTYFGYIFGAFDYSNNSDLVPSSLKKVTITKATSIGESAFYGCSSLPSITIPDSVTSIGNSAFYDCISLTSVTIGNSVTSIGSYAFSGCSSLTSIIIPDSVTSIGNHAFYGCSSLTSITIPDGVTSIGSNAFYGCSSLTSVTIGNSVTRIGSYAFEYCRSLTSITIPDSVTSIGSYAFEGCSSLTSITFENPNGWRRYSSSWETSGTSISGLDNTSTAATYLTSTYCGYYWKRS